MVYNCSAFLFSGKECDKKAPRFVVLSKKKEKLEIAYSCEYHFSKFYDVPMEKKGRKEANGSVK